MAAYGFDLMMCAVAYIWLQRRIIQLHGEDSPLSKAVGADTKGKISLAAYALAMLLALFSHPWLAGALLIAVALIWFVPDPRIERVLGS